ncbi:MAG: LysR substrate-binding domain-containing protein [Ilumatobacter sp.]|uniref:LysR substrate-binding domain-containing protein n=1 Tax=Ilumatobacter sp. TaxID=1967498 RepID=UPI002621829B|nr:LysR substrate-binding domain-containing protein [Ilumatobacter sp.]MDJ0771714.1 LysR substrate-binding domain-containing protein [Ilumatobacter sp.]
MSEFERRLPPLATLVVFEAAFRHRNFTRAATELFLSQASVSRRVRELEGDLGVSLFERGRYDVTPTDDAERLAASVRMCLSELASTAEAIRRRAVGQESLTILADPSLAAAWVVPVIGDYQRRNPNLTIRVISSCEAIEETREEFDIALQYGHHESSAYDVRFVAHEDVFPVCSPSFAARVPPLDAADLADLPLLHVEYSNPSWATWQHVFDAFAVGAPAVDGALVFSSYQVCLDVAERGEGIALGWQRSVQARLDAGSLVRIPGITLPMAGTINAYTPKYGAANPHAPGFLALLGEIVSLE